jgi:hypothetical protein
MTRRWRRTRNWLMIEKGVGDNEWWVVGGGWWVVGGWLNGGWVCWVGVGCDVFG